MPAFVEKIGPRSVTKQVHRGFQRFSNFRNANLMFLRNYTGPYYDKSGGDIGSEAINLIYHGIQTLLPNIAMNYPEFTIESRNLDSKPYGELLEIALNDHSKEQVLMQKIRQGIVDALFTIGIFKTGLTF